MKVFIAILVIVVIVIFVLTNRPFENLLSDKSNTINESEQEIGNQKAEFGDESSVQKYSKQNKENNTFDNSNNNEMEEFKEKSNKDIGEKAETIVDFEYSGYENSQKYDGEKRIDKVLEKNRTTIDRLKTISGKEHISDQITNVNPFTGWSVEEVKAERLRAIQSAKSYLEIIKTECEKRQK